MAQNTRFARDGGEKVVSKYAPWLIGNRVGPIERNAAAIEEQAMKCADIMLHSTSISLIFPTTLSLWTGFKLCAWKYHNCNANSLSTAVRLMLQQSVSENNLHDNNKERKSIKGTSSKPLQRKKPTKKSSAEPSSSAKLRPSPPVEKDK